MRDLEFSEIPQSEEIHMLAGWRQWADAGSVSSGIPEYLVQQTNARSIGMIPSDGFYLFQIPGTHHLLRPIIHYDEGFPRALESFRNEFFFSGNEKRGLVIFLGDEPHMDVERYVATFLDAAQKLGVKKIVGVGGVYGELPYDKDRFITGAYSMPRLKEQMKALAVSLSDYQGGASIDSFVCRRAAEREMDYMSFYAFVPLYDFSNPSQTGSSIRIENDYTAWLGLMQRINYLLKLGFDLSDLENKSRQLIEKLDHEIEQLIKNAPELGLRDYLQRLAKDFTETPFVPPDDFWEEKLRGLFDDFD